MPFKDMIKALGIYGGTEEGLDKLAPEVAENPFYVASQSEAGMSRRTFIKAALLGAAAACGAGKVGKAYAQEPVSVYVEDFGECFFVPDRHNATPGIGPGTSSQIANYLAYFKDKGIKVNRGKKENSQIVLSGQVVVDWYHPSILINVEYKNQDGEIIERDTFAHNFYDYPNCLFEDSQHIAEEVGNINRRSRNLPKTTPHVESQSANGTPDRIMIAGKSYRKIGMGSNLSKAVNENNMEIIEMLEKNGYKRKGNEFYEIE